MLMIWKIQARLKRAEVTGLVGLAIQFMHKGVIESETTAAIRWTRPKARLGVVDIHSAGQRDR